MEGPCECKLLQLKLRIGRKILSRFATLKYPGCVHRYKTKSSCQWFIWILLTLFFAEYLALRLDFSGFSSLHNSPLVSPFLKCFLLLFFLKALWIEGKLFSLFPFASHGYVPPIWLEETFASYPSWPWVTLLQLLTWKAWDSQCKLKGTCRNFFFLTNKNPLGNWKISHWF